MMTDWKLQRLWEMEAMPVELPSRAGTIKVTCPQTVTSSIHDSSDIHPWMWVASAQRV